MAHQRAPFYNTDAAVGKGQPNATDDVLLVQFFLSEEATKHTIFAWNKPATPLNVNGRFDDNLTAWIRSFQEALKGVGSPVTVDGIVNSVPGAFTSQTTRTHTKYTLMFLNNLYESMFPDKFRNLPNEDSVPVLLRRSLNQSKR